MANPAECLYTGRVLSLTTRCLHRRQRSNLPVWSLAQRCAGRLGSPVAKPARQSPCPGRFFYSIFNLSLIRKDHCSQEGERHVRSNHQNTLSSRLHLWNILPAHRLAAVAGHPARAGFHQPHPRAKRFGRQPARLGPLIPGFPGRLFGELPAGYRPGLQWRQWRYGWHRGL